MLSEAAKVKYLDEMKAGADGSAAVPAPLSVNPDEDWNACQDNMNGFLADTEEIAERHDARAAARPVKKPWTTRVEKHQYK